jgi:hypothetical protein
MYSGTHSIFTVLYHIGTRKKMNYDRYKQPGIPAKSTEIF